MNSNINALLPRRLVKSLRNTWLGMLDLFNRATGKTDALTPPASLHYVGGGDFQSVGREFLGYFRQLCHLRPDERVLDIGCGTGRMAVPLLGYLTRESIYIGFDISAKAIEWCENHISRENSSFKFFHADIYNKEYNPKGRLSASEYRFPCEDESVDFIIATSVFTHLGPEQVRHYLSEIFRTLRKGGRCFITYFILNEESIRLMPDSGFDFNIALDGCHTIDPKTPERAIAYTEASVKRMHERAGLKISEPIRFGSWCGRETSFTGQDIVIARKADTAV
jgi:SAM-dependent methyltransferase